MQKKVGRISERVAELLGLSRYAGQEIFLGDSNVIHMQSRHPEDYEKYGMFLPEILASPDYVGVNPKDGSVEYVREFRVEDSFVKVAVRLSGGDVWYARSLYVLNPRRVENFISKGTLKRI